VDREDGRDAGEHAERASLAILAFDGNRA
jgi:hypothetical protein